MKKLVAAAFIASSLLALATPASAFWLERSYRDHHLWTVHCKNREDYPLRGGHGDAVEFARIQCNELVSREERGVNYRASAFFSGFYDKN